MFPRDYIIFVIVTKRNLHVAWMANHVKLTDMECVKTRRDKYGLKKNFCSRGFDSIG